MKICIIEGCDKPYKAKGYCSMHYERLRTKGSLGAVGKIKKNETCNVIGCSRKASGGSFCSMHKSRYYRTGDFGTPYKKSRLDRFLEKIKIKNNGCWEWQASKVGKDKRGYFYKDKKKLLRP